MVQLRSVELPQNIPAQMMKTSQKCMQTLQMHRSSFILNHYIDFLTGGAACSSLDLFIPDTHTGDTVCWPMTDRCKMAV